MRYRNIAFMISIFAVLALVACSSTPQPQPTARAFAGKGYSEVWLDQRDIQVDFKGAMDENVDKLKNLAVLRACEIGKERNFERFVIKSTTDQNVIDGVTKAGDKFLPVEKIKASVVIRFVNKSDPEYPLAFDVNAKIEEIVKKLGIK
ncbi:MAG: hypothetical protein PHN75_18845 [Syntrophales bacterium]|nr:hypothetical protein [Syntrophales bacterium]